MKDKIDKMFYYMGDSINTKHDYFPNMQRAEIIKIMFLACFTVIADCLDRIAKR